MKKKILIFSLLAVLSFGALANVIKNTNIEPDPWRIAAITTQQIQGIEPDPW